MVKNLPANAGDTGDLGSVPGLGRSPGGGNGNPPPVFLLGKSNGQRRLVSYSPQGCKELDGTHSGRSLICGVIFLNSWAVPKNEMLK